MIEVTDFRNAMSLLASAVSIITTAGEDGRFGFTASSVCSVTDTPPSLLVCMNKSARSHEHFLKNGTLAVNVLAGDDQELSAVFSSSLLPEQRFQHGNWSELTTGSPVLDEALVKFDCNIEQVHSVGTHSIFICRIVAIETNDKKQGLAYFNRSYHTIGEETPASY